MLLFATVCYCLPLFATATVAIIVISTTAILSIPSLDNNYLFIALGVSVYFLITNLWLLVAGSRPFFISSRPMFGTLRIN